MFVNKVKSLIIISINIKLITADLIPNRRQEALSAAMKRIKSIY